MKTVRDLNAPENDELVAKLTTTLGEVALAAATANDLDRTAAGVLMLRAALGLLLCDQSPGVVGAWLRRQADDLQRLDGGGNA